MPYVHRLPVVLALLALGCGDAPVAESYPDAVAADPDHYAVEFENDVVRVLRVRYGPGERSVMHAHPALCSVALGEASWRMTDPEGAVTENTGAHGDVGCEEASVHVPENAGTAPSEVVLFELKEGGAPGTDAIEGPDAVTVDPDHYSVEFENEAVRVIRIRYEPGESAVLHGHPANCVVWLASPAPEGEPNSVGSVACSDAQTHTPEGAQGGRVELVGIEFKGRAALQS